MQNWFDRSNLRAAAPWVIGVAVLIAVAWKVVKPGPPKTIVISAGAEGGAYYEYAKKYAAALEKNGVKTTIRTSAGSLENIKRLKDPDESVDLAFVQSGLFEEDEKEGLVSLGSLYFEPMWVFLNKSKFPATTEQLTALQGARINVGVLGSGTQKLAQTLLEKSGMKATDYVGLELNGKDAAAALQSDKIDAMMIVAAADAPLVLELLSAPNVMAMNMGRADAISRLIPSLSKVVLPRGAVNLRKDLPVQDITLIASTATLVAQEDLHPAIEYLLIKTANTLHGGPQLLSNAKEFPSIKKFQELEVTEDVEKLYTQGAPFLYKHLPFWLANLLYRLWVLIIPLGAAMLTLSDTIPKVLGFKGNRQIMQIYKEAQLLEDRVLSAPPQSESSLYLSELDSLYRRTAKVKVPSDFVKSLFELKGHLDMVDAAIKRHLPSA